MIVRGATLPNLEQNAFILALRINQCPPPSGCSRWQSELMRKMLERESGKRMSGIFIKSVLRAIKAGPNGIDIEVS